MRLVLGIVFCLLVVLLWVSAGFTAWYGAGIENHRNALESVPMQEWKMFSIWGSALIVSVCGLGLYALDSAISMIR